MFSAFVKFDLYTIYKLLAFTRLAVFICNS